ncbi:unnamed protein product [Alopecurus aequalis]
MSLQPYKSTLLPLSSAFSSTFQSVTRHTYRRTGPQLVSMRLLKCVSFLLGAVILSATVGPCVAIAHRELLMELTVDKTITDEETGSDVLTGQKMVFGDAGMEKKEANDRRSILSSGAKHSVRKCGHGGRKDLGTNCYFRTRKLHPGVYFDGHIPFTADYPRPRHHQPKNN